MDHPHRVIVSEQDPATQVLFLALQCHAVSWDQRMACICACVCRGWRAAVQQAGPPMDISFGVLANLSGAAKLASLCSWMHKHPGSVCSINISTLSNDRRGISNIQYLSTDELDFHITGNTLMAATLQQAAGPGAGSSSSSAAAVGDCAGRRCLLLRSFSSNILTGSDLLAALPAASLTRLELTIPEGSLRYFDVTSTTAEALTHLRGLKSLMLVKYGRPLSPYHLLPAITALSRLTSLQLYKLDTPFGADDHGIRQLQQQLPQSLEKLALHFSVAGESSYSVKFDLQHLNALRQLKIIGADCQVAVGSCLPPQLQALTLHVSGDPCLINLGITDLQQLQELEYDRYNNESPDTLRALAAMSQLHRLDLGYTTNTGALDAVGVFGQIRQLRGLRIGNEEIMAGGVDALLLPEDVKRLLVGIAAATNLTSLKLEFYIDDCSGDASPRYVVCKHLSALTNLKSLILGQGAGVGDPLRLEPNDALHLTALTGLTRLDFQGGCRFGVGDMVAAALACELTNLQWLSLHGCEVKSKTVIPPIARLVNLRHLDLGYTLQGFTEEVLMMLTRLSKLSVLRVSSRDLHEGALRRYWAAMKAAR